MRPFESIADTPHTGITIKTTAAAASSGSGDLVFPIGNLPINPPVWADRSEAGL
jgi:hypothetical protein